MSGLDEVLLKKGKGDAQDKDEQSRCEFEILSEGKMVSRVSANMVGKVVLTTLTDNSRGKNNIKTDHGRTKHEGM